MKYYIDKTKVAVEIKKCYNESLKRAKIVDADYWNGHADAYRNMLTILDDTLGTKEVDLEKEIKHFTMSKELYEADSVIKAVAEHFFELGLKAQKGE